MADSQMHTLHMMLTEDDVHAVEQMSAAEKITASALVRRAVREYQRNHYPNTVKVEETRG